VRCDKQVEAPVTSIAFRPLSCCNVSVGLIFQLLYHVCFRSWRYHIVGMVFNYLRWVVVLFDHRRMFVLVVNILVWRLQGLKSITNAFILSHCV
jgi:hypothetical protein